MTTTPHRPGGNGASLPDVVAIADTEDLLNRLGERMPSADDLDDPLLAALAVLARDVDLDPVPVTRTRRTLVQHGLWPPSDFTSAPPTVPIEGVVPLARTAERDVPELIFAPRTRAEARAAARAEAATFLGSGARASFLPEARPLKVSVMSSLAVAGAAVVLSMGAAAAVTSGESVNPATAIGVVMHKLGGSATHRSVLAPNPSAPGSSDAPMLPGPGVMGPSKGITAKTGPVNSPSALPGATLPSSVLPSTELPPSAEPGTADASSANDPAAGEPATRTRGSEPSSATTAGGGVQPTSASSTGTPASTTPPTSDPTKTKTKGKPAPASDPGPQVGPTTPPRGGGPGGPGGTPPAGGPGTTAPAGGQGQGPAKRASAQLGTNAETAQPSQPVAAAT